jgi:hypothetical protein
MVISVAINDGRKLKFNHVSTESVTVMVEFEEYNETTSLNFI